MAVAWARIATLTLLLLQGVKVAPIITSAAPVAGQPAPGSPNKPGPRSWAGSGTRDATQATAFRFGHQCEGAAPKTRSMIIVYYDSYVQLFFEDLVKFVSASRKMMRKAKMAAKVAQIKRLAELEMPEESDEEEVEPSTPSSTDGAIAPLEATSTVMKDGEAEERIPSLRYMSARQPAFGAARGIRFYQGIP
ncbi:hypothetical protein B0T24DRAFT_595075 [Lasiosphaeria ovina]|uniref:Uncharacterized protein n=1 Tax=Lasiosphaeria ovina TaxID=92902 RepID=A0AAE0N5T1_9PEZI|nr:hypothetical protein B0T24DRAFT_595075 [Lasiosphaeria ovina]